MRRLVPAPVSVGCLLALVFTCFGSVLFRGQQFSFRDSVHYYYPLYERVQQEWDAGRIPLWTPEENAGAPLLGNPTAAVLYPGKVLFAIRPYGLAARLYVIAHVLLAFGGMVVLLRGWGTSGVGSTIAGLSYAFGAPVLFQYSNVIYLVGASWAPLGLHAADSWVRQGRFRALAALAVVLTMQTLGGDPQAAYLTGLCALGYAIGLARVRAVGAPEPRRLARGLVLAALAWSAIVVVAAYLLSGPVDPSVARSAWIPSAPTLVGLALFATVAALAWFGRRRPDVAAARRSVGGLILAGSLAVALAAPGVLPTIEYARQTFRAQPQASGTVYSYSVEPTRLAELVWPNVSGTLAPENRRWLGGVQSFAWNEVWTPSLYLGGLTVMLALGAGFGLREGPAYRPWLTVIAVVGLLAGFGRYASPLWLARCVPSLAAMLGPHDAVTLAATRIDGRPFDGDGGVYWLLSAALPGFAIFRFLANLLTFSALATAALAGLGWDRAAAGRARAVARWCLPIIAFGLVALTGLGIRRSAILAAFAADRTGSTFAGPLDSAGAVADMTRGLAQGCVVLALGAGAVWLAPRRPRLAGALALLLLTADLAAANARLVYTAPQEEFDRVSLAARLIDDAERDRPSPHPFRVHRMPPWLPLGWFRHADADRVRQLVAWERDTLTPLFGLPRRIPYTLTRGALELFDYHAMFRAFPVTVDDARTAAGLGVAPGGRIVYQPRRAFDLWTTRYFLVPVAPAGWTEDERAYASFLLDAEVIYPDARKLRAESKTGMDRWRDEQDWQLLRSKTAYPRAWIVHEARVVPPLRSLEDPDSLRAMHQLLYQDDALWHTPGAPVFDTRRAALVESDDRNVLAGYLSGGLPEPQETAAITAYTPQRVELSATLDRAGLLVLADAFYPGWQLTVDDAPAPILRANRMMRGAALKAGTHRLVFTYRPLSFRAGVGLAAVGLVALVWLTLARRGAPPRDTGD